MAEGGDFLKLVIVSSPSTLGRVSFAIRGEELVRVQYPTRDLVQNRIDEGAWPPSTPEGQDDFS